MTGTILITPPELRSKAQQLRDHAKAIFYAIENTDQQIATLNIDQFAGIRADTVRGRYQANRESLLVIDAKIVSFADQLEIAANVFEKADNIVVEPNDASGGLLEVIKEAIFNIKWMFWSEQMRSDFLEKIYGEIAQKYGLQNASLVIEDLPDDNGDLMGQFSRESNQIQIDQDNFKGMDGAEVVDTLFHETFHQIQWQAIQNYETNGEQAVFPEGITLEDVKSWQENWQDGNYINGQDDFEGYYKQPLERDAREYAEQQKAQVI